MKVKSFPVVILQMLLLSLFPLESKAEKLEGISYYSYGFGAGVAATLCDLMNAEMITRFEGRSFTSNFEESLQEEGTSEKLDLDAMSDGFNKIVSLDEFKSCKLRMN